MTVMMGMEGVRFFIMNWMKTVTAPARYTCGTVRMEGSTFQVLIPTMKSVKRKGMRLLTRSWLCGRI